MLIQTEITKIFDEVETELKKSFGKSLFRPKQDDQYRLLRLRVWSERYKVSISYILSVLIPHFERISNKYRGNARSTVSKGIGTTISVLTGQAAESILVEHLERSYPDNEHVISWKQDKQKECLAILAEQDEIILKKPKTVLQYPTLKAYTKAYSERIDNKRKIEEKLVVQLSRQPWRGNPFR